MSWANKNGLITLFSNSKEWRFVSWRPMATSFTFSLDTFNVFYSSHSGNSGAVSHYSVQSPGLARTPAWCRLFCNHNRLFFLPLTWHSLWMRSSVDGSPIALSSKLQVEGRGSWGEASPFAFQTRPSCSFPQTNKFTRLPPWGGITRERSAAASIRIHPFLYLVMKVYTPCQLFWRVLINVAKRIFASIASFPIDCLYKLWSTVVRREGEKNIGNPLVKPSDFIRGSLPCCEGMNQFARKGLISANSSYLEKYKCERVSAAIGSDSLAFSVE